MKYCKSTGEGQGPGARRYVEAVVFTVPLILALIYFAPGLRESIGWESKANAARAGSDAASTSADWETADGEPEPTRYRCSYRGTQWTVSYEHHADTPAKALEAIEHRITTENLDYFPTSRNAFDASLAGRLGAVADDAPALRPDNLRSQTYSSPGTGSVLMAMAFESNDGGSVLMTMYSHGPVNLDALTTTPSPEELRREIEGSIPMPEWAAPSDKIENATDAFRVSNYFVDNARTAGDAKSFYDEAMGDSARNLAQSEQGVSTQYILADTVEIALTHVDVPGTGHSTTIIKIKTWFE